MSRTPSRRTATAFLRSERSASEIRAPPRSSPIASPECRSTGSSDRAQERLHSASLTSTMCSARAYSRASVRAGWDAMREFGGFEMAMMMGAMFGGAEARQIVIVDGFIATAAACAAVAINRDIRDYLLFAHLSPESGHAALLEWLEREAASRPRHAPWRRDGRGAGDPAGSHGRRLAEHHGRSARRASL